MGRETTKADTPQRAPNLTITSTNQHGSRESSIGTHHAELAFAQAPHSRMAASGISQGNSFLLLTCPVLRPGRGDEPGKVRADGPLPGWSRQPTNHSFGNKTQPAAYSAACPANGTCPPCGNPPPPPTHHPLPVTLDYLRPVACPNASFHASVLYTDCVCATPPPHGRRSGTAACIMPHAACHVQCALLSCGFVHTQRLTTWRLSTAVYCVSTEYPMMGRGGCLPRVGTYGDER